MSVSDTQDTADGVLRRAEIRVSLTKAGGDRREASQQRGWELHWGGVSGESWLHQRGRVPPTPKAQALRGACAGPNVHEAGVGGRAQAPPPLVSPSLFRSLLFPGKLELPRRENRSISGAPRPAPRPPSVWGCSGGGRGHPPAPPGSSPLAPPPPPALPLNPHPQAWPPGMQRGSKRAPGGFPAESQIIFSDM